MTRKNLKKIMVSTYQLANTVNLYFSIIIRKSGGNSDFVRRSGDNWGRAFSID